MTEGHSSAHAEATAISTANVVGAKVITTLSAMSAAAGAVAGVEGAGALALEAFVSSTMTTAGSGSAIPASASSSTSNMALQQQQHVLQAHHQHHGSGASIGKTAPGSTSVVVLNAPSGHPSVAVPVATPVSVPMAAAMNGPTSTLMTSGAPGAEALVVSAGAGGPMPGCLAAASEALQMSDVEKAVAGRGWPRAVDALFSADHDPRLSPLIGTRIQELNKSMAS